MEKKKVGRPPSIIRKAYAEHYKMTKRQARVLTPDFIQKLQNCKDEASRRILLGISK